MKRVKATLDMGDGLPDDWCDFSVEVTLLFDMSDDADREKAGALLRALVDALTDHNQDTRYLEHRLKGRMYMTGRLPKGATFSPDGTQIPDVVIVDDVHGWDFKRPKK